MVILLFSVYESNFTIDRAFCEEFETAVAYHVRSHLIRNIWSLVTTQPVRVNALRHNDAQEVTSGNVTKHVRVNC